MDFSRYVFGASYFVTEKLWWIYLVAVCALFVVLFALQAAALYTIAKREGLKFKWMAFLPFASTYMIGVCANKNKIFGKVDTRIISGIVAGLEFVLTVGSIIYYVACASLATAGSLSLQFDANYLSVSQELGLYPARLGWAAWCFKYLYDYILQWLDLVFLFLQILLLSAFFQTYAARRYFIFTIASILVPVQSIIFFVIRNNKGMNYREYLYAEQERQYRMYRQYRQENFNQNPYNQNPYSQNPYSQNYGQPRTPNENNGGYGGQNSAPEDPFAEFGGNSKDNSDPFDN